MKPKIFIFGSCVSRDAFRLPNRFEIADYIARSSLASAFADKSFTAVSTADIESALTSQFQRRLVRCDVQKDLRALFKVATYDAILLDFVDERFDIIEIDGSVATLSNEMAATNIQGHPHIVRRGTKDPVRLSARVKGLNELIGIADERKVPVILNRVYWAETDDTGTAFGEAGRGNAALSALYDRVPSLLAVIDYERDELVGDTKHVWGRSPFHYVQPVYERTLKQMSAILL